MIPALITLLVVGSLFGTFFVVERLLPLRAHNTGDARTAKSSDGMGNSYRRIARSWQNDGAAAQPIVIFQ